MLKLTLFQSSNKYHRESILPGTEHCHYHWIYTTLNTALNTVISDAPALHTVHINTEHTCMTIFPPIKSDTAYIVLTSAREYCNIDVSTTDRERRYFIMAVIVAIMSHLPRDVMDRTELKFKLM